MRNCSEHLLLLVLAVLLSLFSGTTFGQTAEVDYLFAQWPTPLTISAEAGEGSAVQTHLQLSLPTPVTVSTGDPAFLEMDFDSAITSYVAAPRCLLDWPYYRGPEYLFIDAALDINFHDGLNIRTIPIARRVYYRCRACCDTGRADYPQEVYPNAPVNLAELLASEEDSFNVSAISVTTETRYIYLYTVNGKVQVAPIPDDWGLEASARLKGLRSIRMFKLAEPEPPTLCVAIAGINDNGLTMLTRVANMFRHDFESEVNIREVDHLSGQQVRQLVSDASIKAKENGKDVVVNIDMDLQDYTWEFPLPPLMNRWGRSTKWAGDMANVVSRAFTDEVPEYGIRVLYAHSAGGDATYQSVIQAEHKAYDNVNILNGRTSADKLGRALQKNGYGWWEVKVFTSELDLPATPAPPTLLNLWSGSISNYDAARAWAGKSWVHAHSLTFTGHSGLRDNIGGTGTFQVNLGQFGTYDNVVSTVEDLMLRDWREVVPGTALKGTVSVDESQTSSSQVPEAFLLTYNYPNPFNPVTKISFFLQTGSHVTLNIYNIMGQRVATLVDRYLEAGEHDVEWDGRNSSSGVYFYRLQTDALAGTRKMLLLK